MTGQENDEQLISSYLQNPSDENINALAALAQQQTSVADRLIQIVDGGDDDEIKAGAIRALGEANPALLTAPLRQMLDTNSDYDDYKTRSTGAYLAGAYQVTALKDALENLLRTDSSADVRYWSAVALGELGDQTSLPVLEGAKGDDGWADNQQTVGAGATQAILMIDQRFNL